MFVRLRFLEPPGVVPIKVLPGSSGYDLVTPRDFTISAMDRVFIPLGFALEIPNGYEAQVRSRSGIALGHGVFCLNSPGTIDSSYRGEVSVILMNLRNQLVTFLAGDRIAQMVFQKVEEVEFQIVDSLTETERGGGGFGSTGRR